MRERRRETKETVFPRWKLGARPPAARRPVARVRLARLIVALGAVVLGVLAVGGTRASAQEAWEYAPYRISVWLTTDQSPLLGRNFAEALPRSFAQQARVLAGATWQIQVETPPPTLRVPLLHELEQMTAERLEEAGVKLEGWDKLMVVSVTCSPSAFAVTAREFDASTRVWGPVVRRSAYQRELLSQTVFTTAAATFSPLARIDEVHEGTAQLDLRAGGLIVDDFCPAAVHTADVMQAVVRQDDRYGNPRPNGVRLLDWTLLHINKVEGAQLEAQIHSINRSYLSGRVSSRVKRFALGINRLGERTIVEVLSKTDPPEPLVGYEIYSKDPESEATHLVGHTDWRGQIEAADNDKPLQVLYVRSGGMLLARLPLVPGAVPHASVQLMDDEKRLQAEALVRGVQATLVDLVAQRELLAARIRKKIQEGDLEQAQQLVDRLRSLQTQEDLRGRLDRARREVASENPRVQARIDPLFLQVQQQLARFLQPNLVDKLASEVAAAQKP